MNFFRNASFAIIFVIASSCSELTTKQESRKIASREPNSNREFDLPSLSKNTQLKYELIRKITSEVPSLLELKEFRKRYLELTTEREEYASAISTLAYAQNANLMNKLNICHLSSLESTCQKKVQDIVQVDKKIFTSVEEKIDLEFVKGTSMLFHLDSVIQGLEAEGGNLNAQLGVWVSKLKEDKMRVVNILNSMPSDGTKFDFSKFMISSGLDVAVNMGNSLYFNFDLDTAHFSFRELKIDEKECKSLLKNYSQFSVLGYFQERLKISISKVSRLSNLDERDAKRLADLLSAPSAPLLKCKRAAQFEPITYDLKSNSFIGSYNTSRDIGLDSWGIPYNNKSFSFSLFFNF